MSVPPPDSSDLNLIAGRAAQVLAADPGAAAALAEDLLSRAPSDPRGLLILASARRRLGDGAGGLAIIRLLAARHPRAAMTQYEFGACLLAAGEAREAARVLEEAIRLAPQNGQAFEALGDARFALGDVGGSERAYDRALVLGFSDPLLREAAAAMIAGDHRGAEARTRARLAEAPEDAEAFGLLGEILLRDGRPAAAEIAFRAQLDRDAGAGRFSLAKALFQQQKAAAALEVLEALLAAAAGDPALLNLQAACLALTGDFEAAAAAYEALLTRFERHARLWANYGRVLRSLGRRAEAVAAYRRSLDLDPGLGEAYWSLSNLKTEPFSDQDLEAMRRGLAGGSAGLEDQVQLSFALGKALEDRGRTDEAFAAYAGGAALKRRALAYDRRETTRFAEASRRLFTRGFFEARTDFGAADASPIFIVGLPRSGSTLLEQILASHPLVEGTMELPGVRFCVAALEDGAAPSPPYPDAAGRLSRSGAAELAALYLKSAEPHRRLKRPFFVDKAPNNFLHVGLIHLMLPRAKIVDARRHPLGSCVSAFKQHFGAAQNFSYDLEDLGAYYRDYVGLMRHWDAALPGRVHRVIYEDLVGDLEGEVRRLLEALDLPFDPSCLAFHQTRRAVSTVSSEQVRRPLYREGLDNWRPFEPHLAPLKRALGPALGDWRGAPGPGGEAS